MVRYVVDTDVCVYVILSHPELTEEDQHQIKALLDTGAVVDVDSAIAEQAAELRRALGRLGRKMRLPDALIAATAVTEGAVLVTHNVDDYRAAAAIVGLAVEDPIEPTDLSAGNQPTAQDTEPRRPDRPAETETPK